MLSSGMTVAKSFSLLPVAGGSSLDDSALAVRFDRPSDGGAGGFEAFGVATEERRDSAGLTVVWVRLSEPGLVSGRAVVFDLCELDGRAVDACGASEPRAAVVD